MKNKTVFKACLGDRFSVLPWYIAVSFVEYAIIDIFANAGFDWRNPCMEYTEKGKLITGVILMVPLFLLLAVFGIRLACLFHRHKPVRFFLIETAVLCFGVCFPFFICFALAVFDLLPEWMMGIRRYLMNLIEKSDWMHWPPP